MFQTSIGSTGAIVLCYVWGSTFAQIVYDTVHLPSGESRCKRYIRPSDKDKIKNADE